MKVTIAKRETQTLHAAGALSNLMVLYVRGQFQCPGSSWWHTRELKELNKSDCAVKVCCPRAAHERSRPKESTRSCLQIGNFPRFSNSDFSKIEIFSVPPATASCHTYIYGAHVHAGYHHRQWLYINICDPRRVTIITFVARLLVVDPRAPDKDRDDMVVSNFLALLLCKQLTVRSSCCGCGWDAKCVAVHTLRHWPGA